MLDPGVVPKQAVEYLQKKQLQPAFSYEDVWKEEHNHAFTVAKCMQMDLLKDIQGSLVKSMTEGIPYKAWAKDMTETMVNAGWWGKQEMVDPKTGEIRKVQLGSARRLETIFDVNMNQAYQTGVWERGSSSKAHTHVLYRIGSSRRHRPEHLAWDGLILPKDDPFWDTHWPPLGWGCQCKTRFILKSQADRYQQEGIPDLTTMKDGRPTRMTKVKFKAPPTILVSYVNKRTGQTYTAPKGIDPGFEYNPGKRPAAVQKTQQIYQDKYKDVTEALNGSTKPASTATPVSRNMISDSKKNEPIVQKVLKIIDSIHGDGKLPGLPVKASRAKSFYGKYSYYTSGASDCIALSDITGNHKELTLAHEIGHYIDHQGFPGKGMTSLQKSYQPMEKLLDTMKASNAVKGIKASKMYNRSYYLREQELFARGYAQYVATKSQDPVMLQQLASIQTNASDYKLSQWTNEDFVPIMKAMEDLLKEMGWMQER